MTAIYNAADNTLTEQSDYDPPPDRPNIRYYSSSQQEMYQRHLDAWHIVMQGYSANKAQYEKTLRTISAHDSARSLWKDGQKLVDGEDYEVREEPIPYFDHIDDPVEYRTRAYPIVPVKSEDDLWKEFMDDIWDMTGISLFERTMTMAKIQQKYIITKR